MSKLTWTAGQQHLLGYVLPVVCVLRRGLFLHGVMPAFYVQWRVRIGHFSLRVLCFSSSLIFFLQNLPSADSLAPTAGEKGGALFRTWAKFKWGRLSLSIVESGMASINERSNARSGYKQNGRERRYTQKQAIVLGVVVPPCMLS